MKLKPLRKSKVLLLKRRFEEKLYGVYLESEDDKALRLIEAQMKDKQAEIMTAKEDGSKKVARRSARRSARGSARGSTRDCLKVS